MARKWNSISKAPRGVVIDYPKQHVDERGWLAEIYRYDESDIPALMAYVTLTQPRTTRGPHSHERQTDRFVFLTPVTLYLWDAHLEHRGPGIAGLRFKRTLKPMARVIIPPTIIHAYRNHTDQVGYVLNLPDQLYRGVNRAQEPDEMRLEGNPLFALW